MVYKIQRLDEWMSYKTQNMLNELISYNTQHILAELM